MAEFTKQVHVTVEFWFDVGAEDANQGVEEARQLTVDALREVQAKSVRFLAVLPNWTDEDASGVAE